VIRKGRILERVFCADDPKQSYALYLPSNYTHDKEWPILYCFDFLGEGRVPVERFRDAAEKYGYIVVGSNNAKNGRVELSLAAFKAVWEDTHTRFSINDARVYTAGFSGGARIASLAASLCDQCVEEEHNLVGVIACGAGFQVGLSPSKKTVFTYFATVGTDDFNFPEMRDLEKSLNEHQVANRIVEFEGWHAWAPVELCARAIEWMELQAMKRKKREKDEALIDRLFIRELEEAAALEQSGKLYEAYVRFRALAADFKGLREVSGPEKKVAALKDTEKVKRALRQEADQALKQQELEQEIRGLTDLLQDPEAQVAAIGRLKNRIAEWRKDFEAPEASDRRRVVRKNIILLRALTHLFEEFYELGAVNYADNYRVATAYLEIAEEHNLVVEINPIDPRASYRLACMYAMKGEKKKALAALKSAVEKGFTKLELLETNRELESLRQEAEYQRILDGLKYQ
jgi:predicted esterase